MYFEKKPKKPLLTLNVVALVDISSLLIIFLIMSTVFGESSVMIPQDLVVPKSISKESLENAPQIIIGKTSVVASFLDESMSIDQFAQLQPSQDFSNYIEKIKSFVSQIKPENRQSGVLLNIVADKETPYKTVFDVVKVFRESGFESVLFVSRGER